MYLFPILAKISEKALEHYIEQWTSFCVEGHINRMLLEETKKCNSVVVSAGVNVERNGKKHRQKKSFVFRWRRFQTRITGLVETKIWKNKFLNKKLLNINNEGASLTL
jgi:hypothetical protein